MSSEHQRSTTSTTMSHFIGHQIGDAKRDPYCPDYCIVTVKVPFCTHCKRTTHIFAQCPSKKCTACKSKEHIIDQCPIRCTGCGKLGHKRQTCKTSSCVHCGGAHPYKTGKGREWSSCPILQMARSGMTCDGLIDMIYKEYPHHPDFAEVVKEACDVFSAQPTELLEEASQKMFISWKIAVRDYITKEYGKTPEEIVQTFVQRLQPMMVFSKCHYIFPSSHRFMSTVPGIDNGTASKGVHYGSLYTIKEGMGYQAQPTKEEALAISFLGYTFHVDPYTSEGRGVPQGC